MSDFSFTDYYELLQISPNAEAETIHRVYKMLAQRYHPDNPETGDTARFLLLNQAFETLSNVELRSAYNTIYEDHRARPIDLFETKDFSIGVETAWAKLGQAGQSIRLARILTPVSWRRLPVDGHLH